MKIMRIVRLFGIELTLFLVGCAQGDLPEYTELGSLRVLSLKVSSPEVAPGTSVTLTPYLSDLNGNGRTLTYRVTGCIDPGLERGLEPTCDSSTTKVDITSGTIVPDPTTPFKSPNYTGSVQTVTVNIPSDILTGKSTIEQTNGIDYLVFYEVSASGSTPIKSLKRIRASINPQKNSNPILIGFQVNGASLTSLPTSATAISPKYQSGSHESYSVLKTDGSLMQNTESLTMTWFISDGTFDAPRTIDEDTNTYTPPTAKPTQRNVVIIGVSRDGRGGEDVSQLEL